MADLAVFHYMHRSSVLHDMDGRIKLACLVLVSVSASLASTGLDLAMLVAAVSLAFLLARLPAGAFLRELRYFAYLMVPIVLLQAFTTPGHPISTVPVPGLTEEGLSIGLFFAGRLVVIVILCVVLMGTTPLSLVSKSVEWFLRWIPFVPATRIATMINLTFVFVPLVFDQASEMLNAQRARCVEARRNVVQRILYLIFPLMVQSFRRADEMVLAMESRCYSEDRTEGTFVANVHDWLLLGASLVLMAVVVLI